MRALKEFLALCAILLAFAPWIFVLFVVPGAWFFFDAALMPKNMADPLAVFGWGPLFCLWTFVWFSLGASID